MIEHMIGGKWRDGQLTQLHRAVFDHKTGMGRAAELFQPAQSRAHGSEHLELQRMVRARTEPPVQRGAARARQHPAFSTAGKSVRRERKVEARRDAHLYVEPWSIHLVRESHDRRKPAVVSRNYHVTVL